MACLPVPRCRRRLLASGWPIPLALAAFLAGSPALLSGRAAGAGRAGQSTPDCGFLTVSAHPFRERTQLLTQMGVERWHRQGFRGRGVKIAVLDSGFRGYRAHLGKTLPAHVTVRSFRADGDLEARDSQHGILCGEVLHALAPEAELLFANWDPDRAEQFLRAARWARRQGARIISCSIIMPSWSDGEGGGPVNAALAKIVGPGHRPGDILCFASAGNTAQRHWSGTFRPGKGGYHEWKSGVKDNELTPWGTDQVSVEMCWRPGAEYQLSVREAATGKVVGRSCGTIGGEGIRQRSCAVVRFTPRPRHTYHVRVEQTGGKAGRFHLVALGGGLAFSRTRGSIACPADGPAVLAVGAVNKEGQRTSYSSCGPNSRQPKPDFVATVPFPSLWRQRPFTGTSAAAPQAAGVAALWWSRFPNWTARDVRAAMKATALDLGPAGHDYETGYGRIQLP
jgi:hypothetical protein